MRRASMPESWRSKLERWGFNFFPTYRSTGAWITYIAADHREIRIKVPFGWRTKNYVGTLFGGSICSWRWRLHGHVDQEPRARLHRLGQERDGALPKTGAHYVVRPLRPLAPRH